MQTLKINIEYKVVLNKTDVDNDMIIDKIIEEGNLANDLYSKLPKEFKLYDSIKINDLTIDVYLRNIKGVIEFIFLNY